MDFERSGVTHGHHTDSKVGRLLEEYRLTDLGEEIERRWQGDGGKSQSLRELRDWFNLRLVEVTVEEVGMTPLDGEIENLYRLLTDDDVSSGNRTQARRRLGRDGVDVDKLERDFVSHQAIHTYLRKYRGVEKEMDRANNSLEAEHRRIQRLRNRTTIVAEDAIAHLRRSGSLVVGEADVLTSIRITCRECGEIFGIDSLFEQGGCECQLENR